MNYIKEMNAFYNRLETNPLSASAINLWYALMHINNRAGWLEEFTVAVSVLGIKTAISESALKRARMELQEKGYIRYRSQSGNRAAIYEMISQVLPERKEVLEDVSVSADHAVRAGDHVDDSVSNSMNHNVDGNVSGKPDHSAGALFKQNETKQNKRTTTTGAHEFFVENFCEMNTYIAGEITEWVDDMSEPFILIAMKRALERGKANWGYVKGILKAWMKKGFASVEDVMGEEVSFGGRGTKRVYGAKQVQQVQVQKVVPDWFKNRDQGRQESTVVCNAVDEELTADQEKVARLLAQYGGVGV
jgi:DnaD/phage-associated family protein